MKERERGNRKKEITEKRLVKAEEKKECASIRERRKREREYKMCLLKDFSRMTTRNVCDQ